MRKGDGDAAGEGQIALITEQCLARLGYGDQRRGTGGVDAEGRPPQIQFVGDAGGKKILVTQLARHLAGHSCQVGARIKVVQMVRVSAHAGVNPNVSFDSRRIVTGVLQCLPRCFQKDALLRIGEFGFPGADVEEAGIEPIGVLHNSAGGHASRVLSQSGHIQPRGRELFVAEKGDGFDPGDEIAPEFVHAPRAGKATAHPDNCDAIGGCIHFLFSHFSYSWLFGPGEPARLFAIGHGPELPPTRPAPLRIGSGAGPRRSLSNVGTVPPTRDLLQTIG